MSNGRAVTAMELAHTYGFSHDGLLAMLREDNLAASLGVPEYDIELLRKRMDGKTLSEISRETGFPVSTVRRKTLHVLNECHYLKQKRFQERYRQDEH